MEINIVSWNIKDLGHKKLDKIHDNIAAYIFSEVRKGNIVFILEARTEEVFEILYEDVNKKLQRSHAVSHDFLGGCNFKCSGGYPRKEYVLAFWDKTKLNVKQIQPDPKLFDAIGADVRRPLVVDISKPSGNEKMRIAAWHAPGPQTQTVTSAISKVIQYAGKLGIDAIVGDFNSHMPSGLPTAARSSVKPLHTYNLRQPSAIHVKPAATTIFGSSYDGVLDINPAEISVGQPTAVLSMAQNGIHSDHAPMQVRISKRSAPTKRQRPEESEDFEHKKLRK